MMQHRHSSCIGPSGPSGHSVLRSARSVAQRPGAAKSRTHRARRREGRLNIAIGRMNKSWRKYCSRPPSCLMAAVAAPASVAVSINNARWRRAGRAGSQPLRDDSLIADFQRERRHVDRKALHMAVYAFAHAAPTRQRGSARQRATFTSLMRRGDGPEEDRDPALRGGRRGPRRGPRAGPRAGQCGRRSGHRVVFARLLASPPVSPILLFICVRNYQGGLCET